MRVLVVDDHPIMRLGVRQLMLGAWPGAHQVDEAQSVDEAVALAQGQRPDLIVLDLSLPDATGIEAPARMLQVAKGTPILVLSLDGESSHAGRLLRMGVAGVLSKARSAGDLVAAARRVLGGSRYVTDDVADRMVGLYTGALSLELPHELLSSQEYRVMQLIAAGRSASQIAETMHVSVRTVGGYRARILAKTGWANNTDLTKYCVLHGLTDAA